MTKKDLNVQKIDTLSGRLQAHLPNIPLQIRETIETWHGKGWGVRFKRERTETTIEIKKGEPVDER